MIKKTLHNIRSKPPEVRLVIALVLAIVVTAGVVAIWAVATFGHRDHDVIAQDQSSTQTANAPSPFSALVSSAKGDIGNLKAATSTPATQTSVGDTNNVQVIDAGAQPNDESNPASTNASAASGAVTQPTN